MFDLSIETARTQTKLHAKCGWLQLIAVTCLVSTMIGPQSALSQIVAPSDGTISDVVVPQDGNLTSGAIIMSPGLSATSAQGGKDEPTEQDAAEMVLSILMALDPYQAKEAQTGKLAVFGTPTMGALANRWAEGFKRIHPKTEIEISEMKTAETLKRLTENPNGVAMISRPMTKEDIDELKKSGLSNPIQIEVGQQGLGVFVHSSNPLNGIDQQQFLKIFSQDLETKKTEPKQAEPKQDVPGTAATETKAPNPQAVLMWGEIGLTGQWSNMPVHLICRDEASGTHAFLKNQLVGEREVRAAKQICDSSKEVLETIASDPNAIGITNVRSAMSNVKALKLLQGTEELPANDYSILTGAYPLVRKITLVVDSKSDAGMQLAKEFVKFAICQDGQRETVVAGFFPLDAPRMRAQKLQLEPEPMEQENEKK